MQAVLCLSAQVLIPAQKTGYLVTGHRCRETYHNDPRFSDTQALANSADPDQTAPRGAVWEQSDQGLHCHSICTLCTIFSVERPLFLNLKEITAKFSGIRKFRSFTVLTLPFRTSCCRIGLCDLEIKYKKLSQASGMDRQFCPEGQCLASRTSPNSDPRDRFVYTIHKCMLGSFSCIPSNKFSFTLKYLALTSAILNKTRHSDVVVTSLNDNVHEVQYNQC